MKELLIGGKNWAYGLKLIFGKKLNAKLKILTDSSHYHDEKIVEIPVLLFLKNVIQNKEFFLDNKKLHACGCFFENEK